MRIAPGVPVSKTVETYKNSEGITVQVEEPIINSDPIFDSTYRIPRRPPSPPRQPPKIQRLSKKKAGILADKVAKQELKKKKKVPPRHKRFCKLCQVSCNGTKTFYDHTNSRAHRTRLENKKNPPRCIPCSKTFESHSHLLRHINGAAHQKVVIKQNQ